MPVFRCHRAVAHREIAPQFPDRGTDQMPHGFAANMVNGIYCAGFAAGAGGKTDGYR
jgi:hypothetical protein